MVLPGIQALFGFQLVAVFNPRFDAALGRPQQLLHLAALLLVALAAGLLMTPAAYHRQACRGGVTKELLRVASVSISAGLVPLMVGLALDVYLVALLVRPQRAAGDRPRRPAVRRAGRALVRLSAQPAARRRLSTPRAGRPPTTCPRRHPHACPQILWITRRVGFLESRRGQRRRSAAATQGRPWTPAPPPSACACRGYATYCARKAWPRCWCRRAIRTCRNTCRRAGRRGSGCRASPARWRRSPSRPTPPRCSPTAATGRRPSASSKAAASSW